MGRGRGLSLVAVGAVAVLVSAASASPHGESTRGGTLRLMWRTEPDSVDPAFANGRIGSWALLRATCATLFTTVRDPDTGKRRVVPEVVRSSTDSNGGRTYTFELKRTFRFHTGAPVTARSFADAFDRNANPLLGSPVRRLGFLQEIVGADAAMQGKAKTISGVQVLGRYRLRIRLKREIGDLEGRLSMLYFCPLLPGTPMSRIDEPPGSGPYYLADHDPNRRLVLERNPYYRGGRTANPDRIVWTIETDFSERLRATKQGENDFLPLFGAPDTVVRDLIDEYGLNRPGGRVFRDSPTLSNFVFRFNPDRSAFAGADQAPLRKAINYALDRQDLARAHGHLAVRPTDRLLPAALTQRRPHYPLDGPDVAAAQRWLARAGHRPPKLILYMANFPLFGVRVAEVLSTNLRQLGIEVDVTYFDLDNLLEKLNARGEPWDIGWVPWGAAYPDPAGALVPLLRGTRYEPRMNATNRLTGAARAKALGDLEEDLMRNDPPVAAYAHFTPLAFVSSSLGCAPSAEADLDLGAVCKK